MVSCRALIHRLYMRLEIWAIGPDVPMPGTPGGSEDVREWADHVGRDFGEYDNR